MATTAVVSNLDNDSVKELAGMFSVPEDVIRTLDNRFSTIFQNKFEVWKTKDLMDLEAASDAKVEELVKEYFERIEKERKPLTPDEIQKLLDQDYVTFTVKLPGKDGVTKTITISELPMEAEQKFFNMFRDKLQPKTADVAALALETMDQTLDKRIEAFLRVFGDAFDVIAETVVLCLNWDGHDPDITLEWVKKHMSSHRQWYIVKAQIEVNKLRDFFSELFQSGTATMMTTTGPNAQNLQQLLRK